MSSELPSDIDPFADFLSEPPASPEEGKMVTTAWKQLFDVARQSKTDFGVNDVEQLLMGLDPRWVEPGGRDLMLLMEESTKRLRDLTEKHTPVSAETQAADTIQFSVAQLFAKYEIPRIATADA